MATSPSHQLGELIGDFFELAIIEYLKPIVLEKGYYLDFRHPREARGGKREVIGVDYNGNSHKLDIVIEKNGSENRFGTPKAFIEVAWRRYVKHSKNKVQEIEGAILPLIKTHEMHIPFYVAVLAGQFTENALKQLKTQGFYVLYINYEDFLAFFNKNGLPIRWEENTSRDELQKLYKRLSSLSEEKLLQLRRQFYDYFKDQLDELAANLSDSLDATVKEVIVIPLHGCEKRLETISEAIDFVLNYDEDKLEPILRYEIAIRYNNGMEYSVKCRNRIVAVQILNQYLNK